MNEKGKKTLEAICNNFKIQIIECVISSRDENVQNDFYNEIQEICLTNKII